MNKLVLSLAAASTLIALPVAANAQSYGRADHRGQVTQRYNDHRQQSQQRYRDFRKGERFDSRYARNYQVIGNARAYHLRPAPRGQHWVRSGDNALLVSFASGLIGAVIANAF
jgi:Ni/Co efflux regulator RcnB